MIINQGKKLENAVAFFAIEFKRFHKYWPAQMWIYKLLALLDFRILKATGRPCIGIEYTAMKNGPVPDVLYSNRYNGSVSDTFQFVSVGNHRFDIEAKKEPDLDYFSDRAIDEMKNLVREFINSAKTLDDLISETHKLRSWNTAMEAAKKIGRESLLMEYADEFEENPMTKEGDKLTFQEEHFVEFEKRRKEELEENV
ncbi:type II toxin-antitoxin system antitoxin SocA domain-containing protein [Pyramidobacter piscolens]|uniref:type II toxin-antitoxin system antitoxin SocA domain-containing protein n=1 Tax=Pyramidobacter piscolens TaxID=638849 RepID=UPI003AB392C9